MTTTTVARLRRTLCDWFDPVEVGSMLRAMLAAGVIPLGESGYAGARSAPLTPRHVVLCVLALASGAAPKDAAAEAQRIAGFRLLRRDMTQAGEVPRLAVYENQQINLLDALVCQIARGVDDDHQPPGWVIGSHEAAQAAPDRLVFGDGEPAGEVERSTTLGSRLLADIALLLREPRAEAAD